MGQDLWKKSLMVLSNMAVASCSGSRFVEEKFDGVVKHGSGQLLWVFSSSPCHHFQDLSGKKGK
jgi:hypothetical protein